MEKGEPEALLFTCLAGLGPRCRDCRRTRWRSSVPGLFGGGNREFDDCLDLLVEFGDSLVFADGLDGVNGDHLAVEFDALGGKRSARSAAVTVPKSLPSSAFTASDSGRLAMVSASA